MSGSRREVNDRVRRLLLELVGDEHTADPVRRIEAATAVIAAAEMYRFTAMSQARERETDWAVIGKAMEITGQAAGRLYRRHGHVDPRPGVQPYPGSRKAPQSGS